MPLTPRPRPGLNQGPSAASSCPGAAPISGRPRRRALLRSRPFPLSQLPWLLLLLQASGKRTAARNQNYFYMRSLWEQSVFVGLRRDHVSVSLPSSTTECTLALSRWRCYVAERRGCAERRFTCSFWGGEVPPVPAEISGLSLLVRQFALLSPPLYAIWTAVRARASKGETRETCCKGLESLENHRPAANLFLSPIIAPSDQTHHHLQQ